MRGVRGVWWEVSQRAPRRPSGHTVAAALHPTPPTTAGAAARYLANDSDPAAASATAPVYLRFRFLNITNVEAVRAGARPTLVRPERDAAGQFAPTQNQIVCPANTAFALLLQQEVGPYTYRKHRVKHGVRFVPGGPGGSGTDANASDSVRWREYRYHVHVPELSVGSLQDEITTLNVPLVGACAWGWRVHVLAGW